MSKTIYVDTSALLAVFFKEQNHNEIEKKLESADELLSCHLIEAEFLSAVKRESANIFLAENYLKRISLFSPEQSLAPLLDKILDISHCRWADAYHFACALTLDPLAKELIFFTLDKKQLEIAKKLNFRTNFEHR